MSSVPGTVKTPSLAGRVARASAVIRTPRGKALQTDSPWGGWGHRQKLLHLRYTLASDESTFTTGSVPRH